MRNLWIAALAVVMLPAFAMAEHRYDRGSRYDRGHRDSRSSFSISLGVSSGGHYYRDRSYGHVSYGYSYHRPVYRERVYVPTYSHVYYPPPRVYYSAPAYCPPPVVYYSPPVYHERYYAPRSYVHFGYSYHR